MPREVQGDESEIWDKAWGTWVHGVAPARAANGCPRLPHLGEGPGRCRRIARDHQRVEGKGAAEELATETGTHSAGGRRSAEKVNGKVERMVRKEQVKGMEELSQMELKT